MQNSQSVRGDLQDFKEDFLNACERLDGFLAD